MRQKMMAIPAVITPNKVSCCHPPRSPGLMGTRPQPGGGFELMHSDRLLSRSRNSFGGVESLASSCEGAFVTAEEMSFVGLAVPAAWAAEPAPKLDKTMTAIADVRVRIEAMW